MGAMSLVNHLFHLRNLIHHYEKKYGREKGCVRLLVASKDQTPEAISTLFQAGQSIFGENYLQEALRKMTHIPAEWHFIGPIQRNKTRKIAEHFSWVQSVSDPKIAKRLHEQRPSHLPPLNICIQVNVSQEKTKAGIASHELLPLADYCLSLSHLRLRGLMAIPAPYKEFHQQRSEFLKLTALWQTLHHKLSAKGLHMDTLSMGMSHDFEAAIAAGSTLVRLGRAIFASEEAE